MNYILFPESQKRERERCRWSSKEIFSCSMLFNKQAAKTGKRETALSQKVWQLPNTFILILFKEKRKKDEKSFIEFVPSVDVRFRVGPIPVLAPEQSGRITERSRRIRRRDRGSAIRRFSDVHSSSVYDDAATGYCSKNIHQKWKLYCVLNGQVFRFQWGKNQCVELWIPFCYNFNFATYLK